MIDTKIENMKATIIISYAEAQYYHRLSPRDIPDSIYIRFIEQQGIDEDLWTVRITNTILAQNTVTNDIHITFEYELLKTNLWRELDEVEERLLVGV